MDFSKLVHCYYTISLSLYTITIEIAVGVRLLRACSGLFFQAQIRIA